MSKANASIAVKVHEICKRHEDFPIFAQTLYRLSISSISITQFVEQIKEDDTASWSQIRIKHFFGTPNRPRAPSPRTVSMSVPNFESFLRSTCSNVEWDINSDESLLLHDLIGHLLLAQPITPHGEIIACAGVAGFSFSAGADYFINAILMFSLGLPLFDNVTASRCYIDSSLALKCHAAWRHGRIIRHHIGMEEEDVVKLVTLVVEKWPLISRIAY